jgi:hypothetical protein
MAPPQTGHFTLGERLVRGATTDVGGGVMCGVIAGFSAVARFVVSLASRRLASHFFLPALYVNTAHQVAAMLRKSFITPAVLSTPP